MNQMSLARARENRAILKVKEARYPFLYRQTYKGLLRPEWFEQTFPSIPFVRVPINKDVYWRFETALDLDLFKAWEKSREENP